MVILEAVCLCGGWDCCIYDNPVDSECVCRSIIVTFIIYFYDIYRSKKTGIWKSGRGMGIYNSVDFIYQWNSDVFTGIVGMYLARTYLEVKHRPIYLEKESNKRRKQENDNRD